MAHISLLCYHDKEGKLISHGTSRKILCLSGKGLCMRQGFIHTPSVHVPLTLYCLHTHSFTLLWNDCFSVVVLSWLHFVSSLVCCLTLKKKILTFAVYVHYRAFIDVQLLSSLQQVWRQYKYWVICCFCFFMPDLGSPKGIRFSDVTDTSTTVHWLVPSAWVDSYKVTYVPAHGGQYSNMWHHY